MRRLLPLLLVSLLLGACAAGKPELTTSSCYAPDPDLPVTLVVPFTPIMVPQEFSTTFFDRFIDRLQESFGVQRRVVILKERLEELPPESLAGRSYLDGEIYGYLEDSGCCATEIAFTTRLFFYQPGAEEPAVTLTIPSEKFFDHDLVEPAGIRLQFARESADRIVAQLCGTLFDR